jgi:hypothetical protein
VLYSRGRPDELDRAAIERLITSLTRLLGTEPAAPGQPGPDGPGCHPLEAGPARLRYRVRGPAHPDHHQPVRITYSEDRTDPGRGTDGTAGLQAFVRLSISSGSCGSAGEVECDPAEAEVDHSSTPIRNSPSRRAPSTGSVCSRTRRFTAASTVSQAHRRSCSDRGLVHPPRKPPDHLLEITGMPDSRPGGLPQPRAASRAHRRSIGDPADRSALVGVRGLAYEQAYFPASSSRVALRVVRSLRNVRARVGPILPMATPRSRDTSAYNVVGAA